VEEDAGSGEDDNDAEWYRKEVGHDPETGKHFEIETFPLLTAQAKWLVV
jgi:hypothetical protein